MGLLPGSAVAWTVVAVKGFQSFYYVENRAPMSSSDVTGLLIGLPKAGFIFLYNAPFSKERVSAFLNMQNTRIYTHNNVYTQQKSQCRLPDRGSHTHTPDMDRLSKVIQIRSVTSA